MRRLRTLLALSPLLAADSLAAQELDVKVRILSWYARFVANSAVAPYTIVFALPENAPDDPKLERQLPLLRRALQQARVPTTPETLVPGRDTLLILLGIPEADSVRGEWTHYTLFSSQTDGGPKRETGIYAARLLCSLKQCFFLSLQPVGHGDEWEIGVPESLPPNNALQQPGAHLAVFCHMLRSDPLLRNAGLINSVTAPAAEC